MKGRIKIPAQEIIFEVDGFPSEPTPPVVEPAPPVVEPAPPVVEPAPPALGSEFIRLEDYNDWNQAINQPGKILVLQPGKTYNLSGYRTAEPEIKAIVGKNSTVITDLNAPRYMFEFTRDEPEFGVIGVNFWQTDKVKFKPGTKVCILFFTDFQKVKAGKLALINSRRPPKNQLSHQLAWAYSVHNGDDGNYLHVIGKNIESNGSEFLTLKANGGGGLLSTLQNVDVWNPDSYNPNAILVNGQISNSLFSLDPSEAYNISDIKTHYGYHNKNVRTVLHVGRFVFNIKEEAVFNDREIRLDVETDKSAFKLSERSVGCKMDYQCGDVTNLGVIRQKQINVKHYWEYVFDNPVPDFSELTVLESSFYLSGPVQAYLVFKHTAVFNHPYLTENTKFGDWQILLGKRYGHTAYNHRNISVWWQNVSLGGFYRQSSPESAIGNSQGYTLESVKIEKGQFDPPLETNKDMHPEAKAYIEKLEALQKKVFG